MDIDRRQLVNGLVGLAATPVISRTACANPIIFGGLIGQALRTFIARSIASRVGAAGISTVAAAGIKRSIGDISGRGFRAAREWAGTFGGEFLKGAAKGAGEGAGKWAIDALRNGAGVVRGEGTIGNTEDVAVAEFPNSTGENSCRLAWPDIYTADRLAQNYLQDRGRFGLPMAPDGDILVNALYPIRQIEYPSHDNNWNSDQPTVFMTPLYEIRITTITINTARPQVQFRVYDNYLKMIKYQSSQSLPNGYVILR